MSNVSAISLEKIIITVPIYCYYYYYFLFPVKCVIDSKRLVFLTVDQERRKKHEVVYDNGRILLKSLLSLFVNFLFFVFFFCCSCGGRKTESRKTVENSDGRSK